MTLETTQTELLVIGAGPAGYVAAIRAGQLDVDVTLVEKDAYGGTCLNHGCIPSKAIISATDIAHDAANAESMGIYADPDIEIPELVSWKDDVVSQLTRGVEKLCKANQVALLEGTATFEDGHTTRISDSGDEHLVEFEHAIVATGSRPLEIPNFSYADEPVLNSRQALALDALPDRLVIVGAGYIGMELATVFAKLGTDVTVVEALEGILPTYESDLVRPVKKRAMDLSIDFRFERTATAWHDHGDGEGIRVETKPAGRADVDADGDDATENDTDTLDADTVLVAVGRTPVSDTLALENAGVETDSRGFITTNSHARTNVDHIFAVGDVAGEPMLAHKGSKEGQVAAEVAAGESARLEYKAIPAAVFTDPEIGTVGLTAAEATDEGLEPLVGEFPLRASGRALTTGTTDGFVRIVADADTGAILGGHIVAPHASELIAELALAVELGATLEDVATTVHTHPTLSEAVMEATEKALGHAIHTLNR